MTPTRRFSGRAISATSLHLSIGAAFNGGRCTRLLSGGANVCNVNKNLCPVMARMSMKQSSCYSHPLTHHASDGFPMGVHYDKLDFSNARFGYGKALRIVASD